VIALKKALILLLFLLLFKLQQTKVCFTGYALFVALLYLISAAIVVPSSFLGNYKTISHIGRDGKLIQLKPVGNKMLLLQRADQACGLFLPPFIILLFGFSSIFSFHLIQHLAKHVCMCSCMCACNRSVAYFWKSLVFRFPLLFVHVLLATNKFLWTVYIFSCFLQQFFTFFKKKNISDAHTWLYIYL